MEKKIIKTKKSTISPIEMILNKNKKVIAINEISFFRQSKQTSSLKIEIKKKNYY